MKNNGYNNWLKTQGVQDTELTDKQENSNISNSYLLNAALKGELIEIFDPIAWAIDHNRRIDGKSPIVWAVKEGKKIEGIDPIVYAIKNGRAILNMDPVEWAIVKGKPIEGKNPIIWALDNKKIIDGMPPLKHIRKFKLVETSELMDQLKANKIDIFKSLLDEYIELKKQPNPNLQEINELEKYHSFLITKLNPNIKIFDKDSGLAKCILNKDSKDVARIIALKGHYQRKDGQKVPLEITPGHIMQTCSLDVIYKVHSIGEQLKIREKEQPSTSFMQPIADTLFTFINYVKRLTGDSIETKQLTEQLKNVEKAAKLQVSKKLIKVDELEDKSIKEQNNEEKFYETIIKERKQGLESLKSNNEAKQVVAKHIEDRMVASKDDFSNAGKKEAGVSSGYLAERNSDQQKFMFKHAYRDESKVLSNQQQDDRRDLINEYIMAPLYRRALYDRAPIIEIVNEKDELITDKESGIINIEPNADNKDIFIRSKFFDAFEVLGHYSGNTHPKGYHINDNPEKLSKIEGFEKVMAACFLSGELDYHAGNIGIVERKDENDNKHYIAVIMVDQHCIHLLAS